MISRMYAVYDNKACCYSQPMFFHNDDVAIRVFTELAVDQSTQIGRHPDDFVLFRIGEYDDSQGLASTLAAHQSLGLASSYLVKINLLPEVSEK